MMRSTPFHRALAMMAAIAGAMTLDTLAQRKRLAALGPYESRGKGGKRPHRSVGTKAFQRAAAKRARKA